MQIDTDLIDQEVMIDISSLIIKFSDSEVIRGVDLKLLKGETHILLGKNGSGKSVILKAIAGLITGFEGRISVGNREENFRTGYVFQKGGLFDSMNIFDNIAFGLRRLCLEEAVIKEKVLGVLERVGLSGNYSKFPSELSGGMQKRVGVARAICTEPELLLYDDPTAGLDPILSDSIADLILEIRDQTSATSLIVTHDLMVAEKIADSVSLLYDGRLVFSGKSYDFFNGEDLYARQFINGDILGPIDIY